jgi:hypothetical protein
MLPASKAAEQTGLMLSRIGVGVGRGRLLAFFVPAM